MSFKKAILFFSIILIIFSGLLLIGPRVSEKEIAQGNNRINVDLPWIFGLSMNCDSPEYLLSTTNPARILQPRATRQNRPGMIYSTYLISLPFRFINNTFLGGLDLSTKRNLSGEFIVKKSNNTKENIPAFIAYAIVNFVFTIFSAVIIFLLFRNEKSKINIWIFLSSLFLLFNPLFINTFWSPHTNIFYIFVPLFCVFIAYEAWKSDFLQGKKIYLFAFLSGLGLTAYATFFLFLPAILIPMFFKKKTWKEFFFKSGIVSFLTLFPYVLWIIFIIQKSGSYYNHETEMYHQVVWMFEQNIFLTAWMFINNIFYYFYKLFLSVWPFITGIFIIWFFVRRTLGEKKVLFVVSLLISLLFLLFFSAVGHPIFIPVFFPLIISFGILSEKLVEKNKSFRIPMFLLFILIFSFFLYNFL